MWLSTGLVAGITRPSASSGAGMRATIMSRLKRKATLLDQLPKNVPASPAVVKTASPGPMVPSRFACWKLRLPDVITTKTRSSLSIREVVCSFLVGEDRLKATPRPGSERNLMSTFSGTPSVGLISSRRIARPWVSRNASSASGPSNPPVEILNSADAVVHRSFAPGRNGDPTISVAALQQRVQKAAASAQQSVPRAPQSKRHWTGPVRRRSEFVSSREQGYAWR